MLFAYTRQRLSAHNGGPPAVAIATVANYDRDQIAQGSTDCRSLYFAFQVRIEEVGTHDRPVAGLSLGHS